MSFTITRAGRRLRIVHTRSFSTAGGSSTGSEYDRRPPNSKWLPKENLRSLHPRMIFVRPWNGIQSMAHAFAVIREIEKRFGKIQEFVVLRDSDVWTNNLPYMNATFARAEYADAIPIEGRVIQVTVPAVDPDRDGGVGLDDLEAYLDPKARAEQLEKLSQGEEEQHDDKNAEKMSIMMDVKIERTGMRDSPTPLDFTISRKGGRSLGPAPILRNPDRVREIGEAIVGFGGFAKVPKVPGDPDKPKTRMQMLVERWSWRPDRPTHTNTVSKQPEPPQETLAEPIPWEPFASSEEVSPSEAAPELPGSTLPDPAPPMDQPQSASPPPLPPPAAAPSPPKPEATPKPEAPPKPQPVPKPKTTAPKMSKKQRMVLAARAAGAQAASQPPASKPPENDYGKLQDPGGEATFAPGDAGAGVKDAGAGVKDAGAGVKDSAGVKDAGLDVKDAGLDVKDAGPDAKDTSAESAEQDRGTERGTENSRAASRWWKFLTGDK